MNLGLLVTVIIKYLEREKVSVQQFAMLIILDLDKPNGEGVGGQLHVKGIMLPWPDAMAIRVLFIIH